MSGKNSGNGGSGEAFFVAALAPPPPPPTTDRKQIRSSGSGGGKTVLDPAFDEAAKAYAWLTAENATRLGDYAQRTVRTTAPVLSALVSKTTMDKYPLPLTMESIAEIYSRFTPETPQATILELVWEKTQLAAELIAPERHFGDDSVLEVALNSAQGTMSWRVGRDPAGVPLINRYGSGDFDKNRVTSVCIRMLAEKKFALLQAEASPEPSASAAAAALKCLGGSSSSPGRMEEADPEKKLGKDSTTALLGTPADAENSKKYLYILAVIFVLAALALVGVVTSGSTYY